MKKILWALLLVSPTLFAQVNIIPQPASLIINSGTFTINPATVITVQDEGDRLTANFFIDYVKRYYGIELKFGENNNNFIRLNTLKFIQPGTEGKYNMKVTSGGVAIAGDTYSGTFYGMQTLIQLLPMKLDKSLLIRIPMVEVSDQPRFSYRGLHLDVCRHFFPVEFVKKYIDFIALHKMNYFHWHLTEDQGWRIQIDKYPRLNDTAAWRNGTIIGRYPGKDNDNIRYGGYYTKDEIREVVRYAAERFITVVPEIEMPGHASAAIAAYPQLSCFPEKPTVIPGNGISVLSKKQQANGRVKLVQETWGVFDDVFCAGKEETFEFLQNVIDEVIELFPSKLFHVGGDECPKTHWKKCPNCQKRMKDHNLKDEHELQSYFIQRMEKYLNSKGKTLIGWDEILEGGLAPNAVVMSWRGEAGGIAAAQQNHYVVMTPTSHMYLDYQQKENEDSVTIGGFVSLEKIYSYEPISVKLTPAQHKYIMGAQGNVWTEYMKYPSKVEYMIFPRLSALSEVLWSQKSARNWSNFEKKLQAQFKRYDLWQTNYSKAYLDINMSFGPSPDHKRIMVTVKKKDPRGQIKYQKANQAHPIAYTKPFDISKSGSISVSHYIGNNAIVTLSQEFSFNKATAKKITLKNPPAPNYPGDGAFTLVNGIQNTVGRSRSREFLGFLGTDSDAVIDLGTPTPISSVVVHAFHQPPSWIYKPSETEIWLSKDNKNFVKAGETENFEGETGGNGTMKITFNPQTARYVRVIVRNFGEIPDGNPGAGTKAWLFVDEIEIN